MKRLFPLLAALGAILLVAVVFGPLLFEPGSFIFEGGGDSFKNYYTFIYHALHDKAFWHFGGMAYPYGEQVVFSDGQPMLSGLFQLLNRLGFDFGVRDAFAWHNSLLWLGLAAGAYFLCRILQHFGMPGWYALIGGLGLACLSPQLFRLCGHFALAYVCFFPMYWYGILAAQERKPWPWGLLPCLALYFFGFIQIYYLAMGVFFGAGFYFFQFLTNRKEWKQILLRACLHVILPFALVKLTLILTDFATDRPVSPWGHFAFKTELEGLWYPFYAERSLNKWPPFWHRDAMNGLESEVYLGFAALAFLFISFGLLTSRLVFGKQETNRFFLPPVLVFSVISAFFVLLFSMGYPLKMMGNEAMQYVGQLRQFRAVNRFAWVFYYTAGVAAFVFFYRMAERRQGRWRLALLAPVFVVLIEGFFHLKESRMRLQLVPVPEKITPALNFKRYQAILPFPIFIEGSEIKAIPTHSDINKKTFLLSIQTGLPTVGIAMSRTSWKETLKILPLVYDGYKLPGFARDLPNGKPFLIIGPANQEVHPMERDLLAYAKKLGNDSAWIYYELPAGAIAQYIKDNSRKKYGEALALLDSGQALKAEGYMHKGFEELPSDTPYSGKGAAQFVPGEERPFFDAAIPAGPTDVYAIDFWMYITKEMQTDHVLVLKQYNEKGEELNTERIRLHETLKNIDGDWGYMEYEFVMKQPGARIRLTVEPDRQNYFFNPGRMLLDDLLIRPKGSNVVVRQGNGVLWNNRFYSAAQ